MDIYDFYEERMAALPKRAKEEMDKSFIVIGEMCFQLYESDDKQYVKGLNLNGYRSVWCRVRGGGERGWEMMVLDFVKTDMSNERKWEFLWTMERNRECFFEIFRGKYAKKNTDERKAYEKWVMQTDTV